MFVAFILLNAAGINAFKDELQICPRHCLLDGFACMSMKLTLFQSFAPDTVSTAIKIQHLALGLFAVDEDKQLAAEWVFFKFVSHQGRQAVVGFTHVGGPVVEPDPNLRFWKKHDQRRIRRITPPGSSSSNCQFKLAGGSVSPFGTSTHSGAEA